MTSHFNDQVDLKAENGFKNGTYNKFLGTVETFDGVKYSRKELKVLLKQDKETGSPLTINQHLVKKVFHGEIVEYKSEGGKITGKEQIRKNRKKSWDDMSSSGLF